MNIYKSLVTDPPSVFMHTTLSILAMLVSLPCVILVLPIWLFFLLFQWTAGAWILFWKLGQILATQDVPFAQEPKLRNFVTCLLIVNGTLDVQRLREAFKNKIFQGKDESHVRLKQYFKSTMGRYVRSYEKNFDIKKHIIVYEGPPPNNDEELAECQSELINREMPSNMSPWQLIIIPFGKRRGAKSFAICVRIHHTIGDGYALVGLFSKVVDNKLKLLKPNIQGKGTSNLRKALRAIYTAPLVIFSLLVTKIENPFTRKSLGKMKVAWTKPIDLAEIKKSKTKFGATVNDVLTACFAGAIRRYLTKSGVDSPSDLQIGIAINTRSPSSILNEEIPLENNTTGVLFSLPVATPTLAERIQKTKRRMDMLKGSSEYLLFGFLFKYFMARLPDCISKYSSHTIGKCCSMAMSNVPGPINQLVLEGNVVESAMVWPPLMNNNAISVAVFSYAGEIRVSVNVDTAVISDPKALMDIFTLEVEDLVRFNQ